MGAAERLVGFFVTVDGGDLGQAIEVLGGLFVSGLQVLAMTAPGGVEFDDLYMQQPTVSLVCTGA